MTETTAEPARTDTGQFVADTSNMIGQELANAEAGFKTRPRDPDPEGVDLKAAADGLKAKRAQPIVIEPDAVTEIVGKPDVTEAVSLEQGAKEIANRRLEGQKFVEGYNVERVAETIDAKRSEEIKKNPRAADELGLSAEDIAAAKASKDGVKADPARESNGSTADAYADVDGLEPVTREWMNKAPPQVRQFLDQNATEAETVKQQYSTGLEDARVHTLATLAEVVPHLAGLPPAAFEQGLAHLSQVDPPAFEKAMNILGRVHTITQAQQQDQQRRAQVEHQQFLANVQSEDARLIQLAGDKAKANAADAALLSLLGDRSPSEKFSIVKANPAMQTAEFRLAAWKVAEYDRITSAPKAIPQALPAVQRPGVNKTEGPRPGSNSAQIAALQKQMASAKGTEQAKIQAKIVSLRRSA